MGLLRTHHGILHRNATSSSGIITKTVAIKMKILATLKIAVMRSSVIWLLLLLTTQTLQAQTLPDTLKYPPFIWQSAPPKDCPFPSSANIKGIRFLGFKSGFRYGDTWYPSWAADDNLYSPWTDGTTAGVFSWSSGFSNNGEVGNDGNPARKASTGQAVIYGDDPMRLRVKVLDTVQADPYPYGGRYPCGSLVYNGQWYYGTYTLSPYGITKYGDSSYNWPLLGPLVGFRTSNDLGKSWTETKHTPAKALFGENGMGGYDVKIGTPHFVDFGKNMQYAPDGKAYLVAHGSSYNDGRSPFYHNSWITGDEVFLIRVTPHPDSINHMPAYEYFAGYAPNKKPVWTRDFKKIKALLSWRNNMGCVTITYNPGLKRYLMCVTDGGNTCSKMSTYILESEQITGPWKLVTYMKDFGEQAYFVNIPSKFISADGKTCWLLYSGNYATDWNGEQIKENPPGSHYGMVFQKIELLLK